MQNAVIAASVTLGSKQPFAAAEKGASGRMSASLYNETKFRIRSE
jgi:hypothetical protein